MEPNLSHISFYTDTAFTNLMNDMNINGQSLKGTVNVVIQQEF